MKKRCTFLINRHHNKPTTTSTLRGCVVGFCVRTHLEAWVIYDCAECDEHTPGPPCQTMDEYWKDWEEVDDHE